MGRGISICSQAGARSPRPGAAQARASAKRIPDLETLTAWLRGDAEGGDAALFALARAVLRTEVGESVRLRGLLEFSNVCTADCLYCGIRRSALVRRFTMDQEEIVAVARGCRDAGYGSMTLQSGERRDHAFVDLVARVVERIKRETRTEALPEGLGITLSLGEQTGETYRRWFDAGAHRYLLRVETSDPWLFARLHPVGQSLDARIAALCALKQVGYQLGTGVMIGLPGQTERSLARDIHFFAAVDADMIGMGPYLDAPDAAELRPGAARVGAPNRLDGIGRPACGRGARLRLSLRMIAATRIALRDVNIAATTALQAISPVGREAGLAAGANVLMPIVTPRAHRDAYQLYAGKPCVEEDGAACDACTPIRAARAARPILWNEWGDSPHAATSDREQLHE